MKALLGDGKHNVGVNGAPCTQSIQDPISGPFQEGAIATVAVVVILITAA
jgi:hypothetical protein